MSFYDNVKETLRPKTNEEKLTKARSELKNAQQQQEIRKVKAQTRAARGPGTFETIGKGAGTLIGGMKKMGNTMQKQSPNRANKSNSGQHDPLGFIMGSPSTGKKKKGNNDFFF